MITRTNNLNFLSEQGIDAKVIGLNIPRKINLLLDIYCFLKLILIFLMNRFSSVHSITPKAGLLAMLAANLTRVPFRIHIFTGQVWASSSGIKRIILKFFDKIIGSLTTHNLMDSPSQFHFLIKERVFNKAKGFVFGSGSVSGVNLSKFKANKPLGKKIKNELKIPQDAFIFIYLGRLVKDKGVLDLAKAFSDIASFNTYLIFVGPDEDSLSDSIKEICANKILKIRLLGFSETPYQYLSAADVICLPSYREGFGNVIIEAAAMGIPAVASNIYGITDAVINNQTGLLHKAGDIDELRKSMEKILCNKLLLRNFAKAARKRTLEEFDSRFLTSAWVNFYKKLF